MSHAQVTVAIPEERVPEFYALLGDWLGGRRNGAQRGRPSRPQPLSSSRYAGIKDLLDGAHGPVAQLSFEILEQAISAVLPKSAYKHRTWWANTERNTQARAWAAAGWFVDSVDLEKGFVQFRRGS